MQIELHLLKTDKICSAGQIFSPQKCSQSVSKFQIRYISTERNAQQILVVASHTQQKYCELNASEYNVILNITYILVSWISTVCFRPEQRLSLCCTFTQTRIHVPQNARIYRWSERWQNVHNANNTQWTNKIQQSDSYSFACICVNTRWIHSKTNSNTKKLNEYKTRWLMTVFRMKTCFVWRLPCVWVAFHSKHSTFHSIEGENEFGSNKMLDSFVSPDYGTVHDSSDDSFRLHSYRRTNTQYYHIHSAYCR